jgi:hypothetical protein
VVVVGSVGNERKGKGRREFVLDEVYDLGGRVM